MQHKIICFDFDGTLVAPNGHIHPRDVELLRTQQRVHFIPATGRPLHSVRNSFTDNQLTFASAIPFPMVLQNGAVTYLPGEKIFAQTFIPTDCQQFITQLAQQNPQVSCLLFSQDELEIISPGEHALDMCKRFGLNVQPYSNDGRRVTKMIFVAEERSTIEPIAAEIKDLPLEQAYSLPTVYEINTRGIDKGQMLLKLLDKMGLDDRQIAVVGDGENDLPLFDVADLGFCPTGSLEVVRQRAERKIDVEKTGILQPMLEALGVD